MALDQQYRKMLRDLMLESGALVGQQTLPDGSIIGYSADTPEAMVASVAAPPLPTPAWEQQIEQQSPPQQLSALVSNPRQQGLDDQQRFNEAYDFKRSMPAGASYIRNNMTGNVQDLPSWGGQRQVAAPMNDINSLMLFGRKNGLPADMISKLVQYQANASPNMPSAQAIFTEARRFNRPVEAELAMYGSYGQRINEREKESLGLQKTRAEIDQLRAKPTSEYDKAIAQERAKRDIFASMPPAMREAEEVKRLGIKLKPGEKYNMDRGEIELIPGSEPYRKQVGEILDASIGIKGLDRVIGNMLDRVSAVEKSPGLSSAVGFWDAATPALASGWNAQDKATARAYITNLQEYLQTKGLADLRASGVAPGSITEKEWSKFATMVGNIDPTMDEKSFQKELNNLKQYAANARAEAAAKEAALKKQYGPMWEKYAGSSGEPAAVTPQSAVQGGVARVGSVNEAMKLKSGTRFIDPNGVERVRP